MRRAELQEFLEGAFPDAPPYLIEEVADWGVRMRLPVAARPTAAPAGTVAGPTIMAMADAAAWLAILAQIGPVALAVTTSLHIDFLRKPALVDLVAEGRLLKLGKSLAVADVGLCSAGHDELVAKAQVTYSIPPRWLSAAAFARAGRRAVGIPWPPAAPAGRGERGRAGRRRPGIPTRRASRARAGARRSTRTPHTPRD